MEEFNKKTIKKLSRTISYLLRHGAEKEGIIIKENGYILIDDLIKWINENTENKINEDILKFIVENNDKKRFEISEDNIDIRASQGHSIETIKNDKLLRELKLDDGYTECYHGTKKCNVDSIKKNGLSKMERHAIHFSIVKKNDVMVISGIRNNSDAVITIDIIKAMNDGIKFYISNNEVILSEGIYGIMPSEYFKSIEYY